MSSVNRVILVGNLGADPEQRKTAQGNSVVSFSLATNRRWTDSEGKRQDDTEWHKIVSFGRQAEVCGDYLHKGSRVYVEGRLKTRRWEDTEGHAHQRHEVIADRVAMLGGPREAASAAPPAAPAAGGARRKKADVPF